MTDRRFNALVVSETDEGNYIREVKERSVSELPGHEVLVRVHYSSLNYKDALSASGNKGVTKQYPHTPGIDAAGTVEESSDPRFENGDKVIVTSYDLGQNTPGGFGEYIRVRPEWVVPLPEGLTLRESMILGSAGFTAAYGVYKIEHNGTGPKDGEIVVTGATGGVGSLAVALLAKAGYSAVAATGKTEREDLLKRLGAKRVIHRDELSDSTDKALLHARWAGAVDTVGGAMLDTVIRETGHNGTVTCCGNILGHQLKTSIYPFILRGVSLMGIDSGQCLMPMRKKIWDLLAGRWKLDSDLLESIHKEVTLEQLDAEISKILRGEQTGRILVSLM